MAVALTTIVAGGSSQAASTGEVSEGDALEAAMPPVRSSYEPVPASAVEPEVSFLMDEYGVDEVEARRRLELQKRVALLDESLAPALAETYAGVSIDQANGASVSVHAVRNDARIGQESRRLGIKSTFVQVPNSRRVLDGVQSQLTKQLSRHPEVLLAGVDLLSGELLVKVDGNEPLKPEVDAAVRRYSAYIKLERGGKAVRRGDFACTFPYCDPPLRAGILIQAVQNGLNSQCTAGFNAIRSDGTSFVMTSGHCLTPVDGAKWYTRFSSDGYVHAVGNGSTFSRYNDASGDAGLIGLDNPAGYDPRNTLINYGNAQTQFGEAYPITARSGSAPGMTLCFTGAVSQTRCGTVAYLNATSSTGVGGLGALYACGARGDSGGPVFASNTAYGLVQGGDTDQQGRCITYYQGILAAESRLGVQVRTAY